MVMPDTNMSGAIACAERVRKAIAESTFPDLPPGRQVTLTAGVACSLSTEDASVLLARADTALYEGKAAGRNRVIAA